MTDEKKPATLWCNACQLDVPLCQTKVIDIRAAEGEQLFFAQTVHELCGTPIQTTAKEGVREAPAITKLLRRFGVTEGRAFVSTPRTEIPEDVRQAADALTSFTRDAYRVQVAQREEDLKTVIRRAIELVEKNPRNEPMRTPVSRPAVERMLAEDLAAISTLTSSPDGRAQIAMALFDAGWRPTIDRLVR